MLDFIAGPPHFRYYAGVPLRSSRGINIGSIYILDSKLRSALTPSEKSFLGIMADNVIQHIEMSRDKKDCQRAFRMNKCLSAYVDPVFKDPKHRRRYSDHDESIGPDSDAESRRTADGPARIDVITRAAELLREAMDIEEGGGGVLFLDTALATTPSQEIDQPVVSQELDRQERPQSSQGGLDSATATGFNTRSSSGVRRKRNGITETLAHTYQPVNTLLDQPEFEPFAPEELLNFVKRYPRGRLFTFDQQGQELSDSSEDESLYNGRPRPKRRRQSSTADAANLHAHFPRARQIMFTPIWDSTTGRSAACFIYNCSEYRNFSYQLEFLQCITFTNCVDTELLRLANLKASDQKNDFIGSVSHELRSPLHGILASCEFLQDTDCTSFQQSMINTAESCARTLLDTVNMVLDYSKINAFEKNKADNSIPALADDVRATRSDGLQTDLSAHRNIDLAVLTEEVVEGVTTGHAFNDPQNRVLHGEAGDIGSHSRTSSDLQTSTPRRPDVEVIVEIAKQDWTYWCEPGSMRRIVINLVGNSLKYTKSGFVHVKLETQKVEQDAAEIAILTVRDSGQGISPEYLRDKLFTPFAQESNQAPGIGLGLSLVYSIVNTLGGHIDIKSTVGVGTKTTVRIPLTRKPAFESQNNEMLESNLSAVTDSFAIDKGSRLQLRSQSSGKSIAIYWPEDLETTSVRQEASRLLQSSLTEYLNAWAGVSTSQWQRDSSPHIIVVEEPLLDALLHDAPQLCDPGCPTVVLVLCSVGPAKEFRYGNNRNIEDIRYPIGPQKLARALQVCLDRSQTSIVGLSKPSIAVDAEDARIDSVITVAQDLSISSTEKELAQALTVAQDGLKLSGELIDPITTNATISTVISVSVTARPVDAITPEISATAEALSASSKLASAASSLTALPASRILLVDDNAINLRLLQVGMKKRGYTSISSASDGLQAVNIYRTLLHSVPSATPEIIFMDLSMPVMDGFEATRQIRKIEAEYNSHLQLPQAAQHSMIIALTGLASVTDQKKAYMAGVDSYLMKPVSFAKLTKLLETWLTDSKVEAAVVSTVTTTLAAAA
jgi:signal transduction histidine kinase/DNA-binding NarL/FixJ family response regulator